jgi:hypothetical protein
LGEQERLREEQRKHELTLGYFEQEKKMLLEHLVALKTENDQLELEVKRQNERGWPKKGKNAGPSQVTHQTHLVLNLKQQLKGLEQKQEEKEEAIHDLKHSSKYCKVQEINVSLKTIFLTQTD